MEAKQKKLWVIISEIMLSVDLLIIAVDPKLGHLFYRNSWYNEYIKYVRGRIIMEHFIPWTLTLISVLIAVYSLIRNNAKNDKDEAKASAIDTTTVIVKLENIQQSVNRTTDMVSAIQNEIKSLDHRVTVIETKMGDD